MQEIALENEQDLIVVNEPIPKVSAGKELVGNGNHGCHFYSTTSIKALLKQFRAFLSGQEPIAVLIGALSSGKSTFLKQFVIDVPCSHLLVQGFSKVDYVSLFKNHILRTSNYIQEQTDSEKTVIEEQCTADELLAVLDNAAEEFLFIIDDTDFLPMDKLQMLLFAFSRQKVGRCKLILAGENTLQKRIESVCERLQAPKAIYFNLEPLTPQESKHYLEQIVSPSLPMGNKLISKKNIEKIYSLSEGYFGRINRVTMQLAAEQNTHSAPGRAANSKKTFLDIILTLAIICLLAVVGLRVFTLFKVEPQHRQSSLEPITQTTMESKDVVVLTDPFEEDKLQSYIASIDNLPEEMLMTTSTETTVILPVPNLEDNKRRKKSPTPSAAQHSPISLERPH